MKLAAFRPSGIARAALLLCVSLALLGLLGSNAQTQSQAQSQSQTQAQSESSAAPAAPTDDAAAKAAERKRKFEEQRKLMESGISPSKEESRGRVSPDLRLVPGDVNLLVHDRVQFHLYDKGTEIPNGSWSAGPGWVVASWFDHGIFTIEAKGQGTAHVGAMIGSKATNVVVRVYPGDKMPKGVERSP